MKNTLLTSALFITVACYGQTPYWEHFYGGPQEEIANDTKQTSDGGFITVGYSMSYGAGNKDVYILKTDVFGRMLWQQVVGGSADDIANAVVENPSTGEIYVAGQTKSFGSGLNDFYLIKLSSSGTILWTHTYGGAQDDYANGVVITSAGDVVMAGSTKSYGAGGYDAYLIKVNSSGIVQWTKTFGKTGDEYAYGIDNVHDGGFILAGRTTNYSSNYGYAVRTNSTGDTLWTKAYNIGTVAGSQLSGVKELLGNSAFVFAGWGNSYLFPNSVTMKTDLNGIAAFINFSSLLDDGDYGIARTSDSGFVTIGWGSNFGNFAILTKYDASGTKQWQKYFQYLSSRTYPAFGWGNGVVQTNDGGYVFCGITNLPYANYDFYLVKTDATGNALNYGTIPVTVGGATTFCAGSNVALSVPAGFKSYQWFNDSIFIISGATSSTLNATISRTYQCVMTDSSGQIYISSSSAFLNVLPVPTAAVSPSGTINACVAASPVTLSSNIVNPASYQWNFNGAQISGATSSTYSPTSSGNYSVTLSNSCGTSTSSATVLNGNVAPTINLGCCYDVYLHYGMPFYGTTLSVQSIPGATYLWSNGATTTSYSTCATGTYSVTATNACGTTSTSTVVSGYNDSPVVQASGPTSGCGVTSVNLSFGLLYSNFYQWYFNGNPISGATNNNYTATSTGQYAIQWSEQSNCSYQGYYYYTTPAINVTINPTPLPSVTSMGNITVCSGTDTLTASPSGGTYQWKKDNVTISGATAQSYVVTLQGNYSCVITTPACGTVNSNSILIWYGSPTGTASISSSSICSGNTTTVYVTTSTPNLTYQWRLNGNNISGATNSSYSAGSAGSYDCILTNACGSQTTNAVSLTVNPLPSAIISPSGIVNFCTGMNVTLTASAGTGYTYAWSTGVTTSTTTISTNNSSSYNVRVTFNGCSATSANVTLNQISPVANVWASTSTQFCAGDSVQLNGNTGTGFTYQWYFNGGLISGATSASYTTGSQGSYSVTIANPSCTLTSPALAINVIGLTNLNLKFFTQGYYINGGTLKKVLHNEAVDTNSSSTNADTVVVDLHNAISPYAVAESYKGVLQTNGALACYYSCNVSGHSYYIAVKHRNTIQTWSAAPIIFTATTSYDFTTATSKAYGNNMKQMEPGKWALYTGDINQDENIDLTDFPPFDYGIVNGFFGYLASDLNGDGNVDLVDFPILDANIVLGIFSQHP